MRRSSRRSSIPACPNDDKRKGPPASIKMRRRKAVTLVEELSIPHRRRSSRSLKKLEQISVRTWTELEKQIEDLTRANRAPQGKIAPTSKKEMRDLMQITPRRAGPACASARRESSKRQRFAEYEEAKRRMRWSGGNLRLVGVDRQEVHRNNRGVELPRPDSGEGTPPA